jgi:hypothetical protein
LLNVNLIGLLLFTSPPLILYACFILNAPVIGQRHVPIQH